MTTSCLGADPFPRILIRGHFKQSAQQGPLVVFVLSLFLLVLIATPVVRVILAGVGFLLECDRFYFWASATVRAVLCYSLWHIR